MSTPAPGETELAAFQARYDFQFDDFQVTACRALADGHGVLVAAPTGSGKTVVGEFAVHLALAEGRKCFYTTPVKALSNQKYANLVRRHSAARVGLLTGDNSINGEAPVVVMTTEVLRNMLYAGSPTLAGLGYVVLDEVHYLADAFRGAVWEEVIINLPEPVLIAALSATVSNAEEFGAWLTGVRGGTRVIVHEHRPVPLWQHLMVGSRLYDLFLPEQDGAAAGGGQVNPELVRISQREEWAARKAPARGGRRPVVRQHRPVPAAAPARRDLPAGPCRAAAGHHVHLQPGRLRRGGAPVPGRRPAADHAGRDRPDHRRGHRAHRRPAGAGPAGARLPAVAGRAAARRRRASRRPAARVQGSGRGAVRGRADPGRLRHRDAGPRHQHAGQDAW